MMIYRFIPIVLCAFLLFACGGNSGDNKGTNIPASQLEEVQAEDQDGFLEKYSRRKDTYAKEGVYERFDPDNELVEKATFQNDSLHGFRILYYETGDTQIVEHYQNGNFDGEFKAFYPNGQLELVGKYEDNVMTGVWKRYYDTGELYEEVTFQDNEENGPFFEYYRNGNLKAEGYYKNGDNEHGALKMYNEEGEHVKTMNCENGVCRTIWETKEAQRSENDEQESEI